MKYTVNPLPIGKKQLSTASSDTKDTSYACSSTGSYQRNGEIRLAKIPVHLMTLDITLDDAKDFFRHRPEYKKTNKLGDLKMEIYI